MEDFESPCKVPKAEDLSTVFLTSPESIPSDPFSGQAVGNRLHFQYCPSPSLDPDYSDLDEVETESSDSDEVFTRSCVKAFSNILSRRISRAMIELIGIEPNPGPVTGKTLSNLLNGLAGNSKRKARNRQNQAERKQKSTPRRKSRAANLDGNRKIPVTGIPAAFGMVAPRAYFTMGGSAQRLADQDSRNAVRARGCALLGDAVQSAHSVSSTVTGAFGGAGVGDKGYSIVTPNTVDPRLNALAQTFQFYAFRRIVLKYIPFVGTTTNGGLYAAIAKDADQAISNFEVANPAASGFSGGTTQNVMEYDPSVMTAIWQPAQLTFSHLGTELWQTFPNGEEPTNERIQAIIVGVLEQGDTGDHLYGHMWLEYEIDFYVPGPPLGVTNVSGPAFFLPLATAQTNTGALPTAPTMNVGVLANLAAGEYTSGETVFSVNSLGLGTGLFNFAIIDAVGTVLELGPPVLSAAGVGALTLAANLSGFKNAIQLVGYAATAANLIYSGGYWKSV
jgi:hypothetical protein